MAELLVETYESRPLITESAAKEREYFLEGICMQANIKNRNGRIYPREVVKREVDRYIREFVETNMAVGELNHPTTDPSINYERVSHKYEWLKEDGNNWFGSAVRRREGRSKRLPPDHSRRHRIWAIGARRVFDEFDGGPRMGLGKWNPGRTRS